MRTGLSALLCALLILDLSSPAWPAIGDSSHRIDAAPGVPRIELIVTAPGAAALAQLPAFPARINEAVNSSNSPLQTPPTAQAQSQTPAKPLLLPSPAPGLAVNDALRPSLTAQVHGEHGTDTLAGLKGMDSEITKGQEQSEAAQEKIYDDSLPKSESPTVTEFEVRRPLSNLKSAVRRRFSDLTLVLPDRDHNKAYWWMTSAMAVAAALNTPFMTAHPALLPSASDRGLNSSAAQAAAASASLLTAWLPDRYAPLAVMRWGFFLQGLSMTAMVALALAGHWSVAAFVALNSLGALFAATAANATGVLSNHIVGPYVSRYNRANSIMLVINAAIGVGAPLASVGLMRWLTPLALSAISWLPDAAKFTADSFSPILSAGVAGAGLLLAALMLRWLKDPASAALTASRSFLGDLSKMLSRLKVPAGPAGATPAASGSILGNLFKGLSLTARNPTLAWFLGLTTLRTAATGALIFVLLPSYLASMTTLAVAFALMLSANNLGNVVASLSLSVARTRKTGLTDDQLLERQARLLTLLRAASSFAFAGVFLSGSVLLAAALLGIAAALSTPAGIVWGSLTQRVVIASFPSDQGKVLGTVSLLTLASTALGGLILGPLATALPGSVPQIAVAVLFLCAVFDLILSRKARIGAPQTEGPAAAL